MMPAELSSPNAMRLLLRPAERADAEDIAKLHVRTWQAAYHNLVPADYLASLSVERRLAIWMQEVASTTSELLVAADDNGVLGFVNFGAARDAAAHEAAGEIYALYVAPEYWGQGLGRTLCRRAVERLVLRGRRSCYLWMLEGNARAARFYERAGFSLDAGKSAPYPIAGQTLALAFCARANLQALDAADLQAATRLASARGLARHAEALVLEKVAVDAAGRDFLLAPEAAAAWWRMQAAASADGVTLLVLSAFRSEARQREIIAAKLAAGDALESVLRLCAAPGFSEHHSARAVDVGSPGAPPFNEDFEHSEAYAWLTRHAAEFGFALSYPRDNPQGYQFEPWHWCYHDLEPGEPEPGRSARRRPVAANGEQSLLPNGR